MTDKLIYEEMVVLCNSCHTETVTNDITRFRESGHTYPPTVYFICGECGNESALRVIPKRIIGRLVKRICNERGWDAHTNFNRGVNV